VNQTALFNGFIYAATNAGIRRASISNNNLNDFKQWEIVATGNWFSVAAFESQLMLSTVMDLFIHTTVHLIHLLVL
jgi:hypothetical protein